MSFEKRIHEAVQANNSLLCVGLDPHPDKMPDHVENPFEFCKEIVEATRGVVCAFKPNSSFFEKFGAEGIQYLKDTCDYIKEVAPEIPLIMDYKRGDIGNTNNGYVESAFEYYGADAVTVSPYMGKESLQPFLDQEDKGIIVLCRTSNSGAGEFQDLELTGGQKLYQKVAHNVSHDWNEAGNCALVVGATYPEELADIRQMVGDDMLLLVPGVGAQGGDVEKTVRAGTNSRGEGIIVNSSRGIIYAGSGLDFARAAYESAKKTRDEINQYRKAS